jgi:hypothetical protein
MHLLDRRSKFQKEENAIQSSVSWIEKKIMCLKVIHEKNR